MTLTRASITEMVAAEYVWSQKQSSEYVDLLLEIMKKTLAPGEDILISGFGKFHVKSKECSLAFLRLGQDAAMSTGKEGV